MPKPREIKLRQKAVRNIHKITKVMKMIATARYQKAFKRSRGTRPYAEQLRGLLDSFMRSPEARSAWQRHPLFKPRPIRRSAILIVTSNRGLAGGYNSRILRLAMANIQALEKSGQMVDVHIIGKKGAAYFRFNRRAVAAAYTTLADSPRFAEAVPIAERLEDDYAAGRIDAVKLVYMRFFSVGRQGPVAVDLLPLASEAPGHNGVSNPGATALAASTAVSPSQNPATPGAAAAFDFSPDPGPLLAELMPDLLKSAIFQALVDASVSEQIARMVAMTAATDNAETMGRQLSRAYNRARQTQITSALSELMGGVEALA